MPFTARSLVSLLAGGKAPGPALPLPAIALSSVPG